MGESIRLTQVFSLARSPGAARSLLVRHASAGRRGLVAGAGVAAAHRLQITGQLRDVDVLFPAVAQRQAVAALVVALPGRDQPASVSLGEGLTIAGNDFTGYWRSHACLHSLWLHCSGPPWCR